jgi:hypothetical protein
MAETKMMKRIMPIMAVAAFALVTGAKAQGYYNFDVTVHQDPQYPQPPSMGEIIATEQVINQQNTVQFHNMWVYQLNNVQRAFWVRAVPGLGAALAHNDWGAACSFYIDWFTQEQAYEKKFHQFSPAYIAANNATYLATHKGTRNHK